MSTTQTKQFLELLYNQYNFRGVYWTKEHFKIEKILHLGDILISYGDFVENNAELVPSGYVEEIWIEELQEKIKK